MLLQWTTHHIRLAVMMPACSAVSHIYIDVSL
jgi:hypothetical protein